MLLTSFLTDLLSSGAVTLAGRPAPFAEADLAAAGQLLRAYHADDALELPHHAPDFDAPAALWAAGVLYHTIQLALVRELDEAAIHEYLPDYPREATPAAVYSADLCLRYLPDLLRLARGLAPADALVSRLLRLARHWPLSFDGPAPPDEAAEARVLGHPALRQEYVDRLIRRRDRARAEQPRLRPLVLAALGQHAATLWPEFAAFSTLPTS
jgi:hypothetical protein